jgi:hypothetical protein
MFRSHPQGYCPVTPWHRHLAVCITTEVQFVVLLCACVGMHDCKQNAWNGQYQICCSCHVALCTCAVLITHCIAAVAYLFCWLGLLLCLQYRNAKMNNGSSTAMTRVQDVAVDMSVVVECTCGDRIAVALLCLNIWKHLIRVHYQVKYGMPYAENAFVRPSVT